MDSRMQQEHQLINPSRVTGDKKKSGIIRKYGLNMSRQAFREKAEDIGFKKVRAWSGYNVRLMLTFDEGAVIGLSFPASAELSGVSDISCPEWLAADGEVDHHSTWRPTYSIWHWKWCKRNVCSVLCTTDNTETLSYSRLPLHCLCHCSTHCTVTGDNLFNVGLMA